jgi:hypothetical protein
MIEIQIPSGNYLTLTAESGDILEFYVESYGQALIAQDDLNTQAQGQTTCTDSREFQAINASPNIMRIRIDRV